MPEFFFNYKTIPYMFDTKQLKLFRLRDSRRIEIRNPETFRIVRMDSIEINREHAVRLALEYDK
jgi:hypothetical protein